MEIPADEFEAKCLQIMERVARTGKSITITKRGIPLAKLVPPDTQAPRAPLKSAVATKLVDAAAKAPLLVSVISAWEMGMLVAKKRLGLNAPVEAWIKDACNQPEFDITVPIALDSIHLPGTFHADAADRFLVATARAHRAMLVTRDERIIEYATTGHIGVMAV